MNVAGRKIVGSTSTPASAGFSRVERLLDVARDLQRVARRLLLDDQQQARAVVDDGVADRRREALDDRRRRRRGAAARRCATRTDDRLRDPSPSCTAAACVTASRWFGVSTKPPACSDTPSPRRRHDLVERHAVAPAAGRDRPAPATAGRAGPRWRRWRRRAPPSAAAGSSTAPASSARSATASSTSGRSSSRG